MSSPKISVIVPVYNVSQFLRECVDSIVKQTFEDIEIILVNDKSPDAEDEAICLEYAHRFDSISYLKHDYNKGLGGARNTGILAARGEFLSFVDSDDWLEATMLEELYSAVKRSGADIAQCYFYKNQEGKKELQKLKQFKHQVDIMNSLNSLAWNKIYKRSLFIENEIFYPEHLSSEDVATTIRLLYFVDDVILVKKGLYNYRINRKGALTSRYQKLFQDLPKVFDILRDFLIKQGRLESDSLFLEKRILKSLNHHLFRLIKDESITGYHKNQFIKDELNECTRYLNIYPEKLVGDLSYVYKQLKKYQRLIDLKIFILEFTFLLKRCQTRK